MRKSKQAGWFTSWPVKCLRNSAFKEAVFWNIVSEERGREDGSLGFATTLVYPIELPPARRVGLTIINLLKFFQTLSWMKPYLSISDSFLILTIKMQVDTSSYFLLRSTSLSLPPTSLAPLFEIFSGKFSREKGWFQIPRPSITVHILVLRIWKIMRKHYNVFLGGVGKNTVLWLPS